MEARLAPALVARGRGKVWSRREWGGRNEEEGTGRIRASLQIAVGLVRPGSDPQGAAVGRGERAGRMSWNQDGRDGFLGLSPDDKWAQFPFIKLLMIINKSFDIDPKVVGKARFFAAFATRQSRANVFKASDASLFAKFSCYRK
jgi:hypothetical protein